MSEEKVGAMVGAKKAGEVFKETYDVAVRNMHPEDALSIAQDAALNYLDHIGLTRPGPDGEYEGMTVKVSNVDEIAEAVTRARVEVHE